MVRKGFSPSQDTKDRVLNSAVLLNTAIFQKPHLQRMLDAVEQGHCFFIYVRPGEKYHVMPRRLAEDLGLLTLKTQSLGVNNLTTRPGPTLAAMRTNEGLVYTIPRHHGNENPSTPVFVRQAPVIASFPQGEYVQPQDGAIKEFRRLTFFEAKDFARRYNQQTLDLLLNSKGLKPEEPAPSQ
jgi:hypothetical protein